MDINMPKLNGIGATRRIKAHDSEIKVIGLSLHNDQYHVDAMIDAGATELLPKENDAYTKLLFSNRVSSGIHACLHFCRRLWRGRLEQFDIDGYRRRWQRSDCIGTQVRYDGQRHIHSAKARALDQA